MHVHPQIKYFWMYAAFIASEQELQVSVLLNSIFRKSLVHSNRSTDLFYDDINLVSGLHLQL